MHNNYHGLLLSEVKKSSMKNFEQDMNGASVVFEILVVFVIEQTHAIHTFKTLNQTLLNTTSFPL